MAWESAGHETAPTILLIAGLASQLTMWNDDFCAPLIEHGYRLVRFDNRDMGLTEEHPKHMRVNIPLTFMRNKLGLYTPSNYKLDLLADDTLGLIEALKLNKPHLLGISMGGMVAQIMAAKAPDSLGKLVLLMSSTNHVRLPMPSMNVMRNMFLKVPKSHDMEDVVKHVERVMTAIGSPAYPTSPEKLRTRARAAYERSFRPTGTLRQTHSVIATSSIEPYTREIRQATCVIHGLHDPLLKKECAQRICSLVPNSQLHLIPGLGHDLPEALSGTFGKIIHSHLSSN